MVMRNPRLLNHLLPAAAAALFMQVGAAGAATPQVDIQQQMRNLLSGSIAARTVRSSVPRITGARGSDPDAQEFARQLLLGWSISHVGSEETKTMRRLQATANVPSHEPAEDFQPMVQRVLLGEPTFARGAL